MEIRSLHFVIATVAGWLLREQGAVIAYLKEENNVPREQLGKKPIKFTDSQRRRLARKGSLLVVEVYSGYHAHLYENQ